MNRKIGDGAEWIWNIAKDHFPGAVQIVDLFHARQHLWDLARLLYPTDIKRRNPRIGIHQKRWLDKGKISKLVASLHSIETLDVDLAKKIRNEADYFAANAARMDRPKFRKQHLSVGSGVIEAGCKTVVGIASNSPACSGPWPEPTLSSRSAAPISMAASRITGRADGRPDLHFCVAHPPAFGTPAFGTMEIARFRNPNSAGPGRPDQTAPACQGLVPGGACRPRRHAAHLPCGSGTRAPESISADAGQSCECAGGFNSGVVRGSCQSEAGAPLNSARHSVRAKVLANIW
jgi:hypothetical protein